MRKIRELLRLKYEVGRSHREIATSLGIANSTVSDYVRRASAGGFTWPLPEGLDYTFVDVTRSRSLPDWTMSHVRMFEFWRGVPELVIPDNEKAAVHKASRYEPDLNPTYQELATHYGTTVLPARPRAPRDKAKAETAVQHVER